MKKIVLLSMLFPIVVFAELNTKEINNVLLNIHASKELKYYIREGNNFLDKKIKFTSFSDADIILFPQEKVVTNKMIIENSYQKLKKNKNSIGAIYLKKNRTQIIFIKERLKDKGLTLPKKFNKYIVSSCRLNSKCI